MNCRDAQSLIPAEKDGALTETQRAGLEAHLAGCDVCRKTMVGLQAVTKTWRDAAASAEMPDPSLEWRAVRARMQAERERSHAARFRQWMFSIRGLSAAAVAAAAFAIVINTMNFDGAVPVPAAMAEVSGADFVETSEGEGTPLVFVDQPSGWLFVWVSDEQSAT